MKTKLFLAAVAVTFSFAMMSCTVNKTTNAASEGEETTVETVEAVVAARLRTLVLLLATKKLIAQKRKNVAIRSNLLI